MTEEWRDIAGWEGVYQVSDQGRVRSLPRARVRETCGQTETIHYKGKIIKGGECSGYTKMQLRDGARLEKEFVHRLVCVAFHGPAPEGCLVAHNDGSRDNNAASNLRWATPRENMQDKAAHGVQLWGEQIHFAKLKEHQAVEIRTFKGPARIMAARFGVSRATVSDIRRGRSWRQLEARA